MYVLSLIKKPSAWIPIALSVAILLMELGAIVVFGTPSPKSDEGVLAHLFQIWLVLEALLISFFVTAWVVRSPVPAVRILLLQVGEVFAGCFPVYYFHL